MGRLFGTDGVRGVANTELTCDLAFKLGQAGAFVLTEETHHVAKIIVGMDTRISGGMLESALVAGICSVGAHAVCLGVVPTPAVAYLVKKYKADAGVVISASHNPFEFNGIKFFNDKGYKLSDKIEERIEAIILDGKEKLPVPTGELLGDRSVNDSAIDDYIEYAKSTVEGDLKGIKIAIDCANGAAYQAAPKALREMGAEIFVIDDQPNGININKNCGSTHLGQIQQYVKICKADIGLAFDGDADRVLAVDETGNVIDGDKIMAIIGMDLKKENKLNNNTIVATVMSNLGLDVLARENGITIDKTQVGDRYVLEEMLKKGHIIGGEQSGHIIFLEYNTTGDGLITGLQLLQVLKKSSKKLSELSSVMNIYPQVLKNAKVSNQKKYSYMSDEVIARSCNELEALFSGEGRVLIRPSGTEPLVRVMIEGKDLEFITKRAHELALLIEDRLG